MANIQINSELTNYQLWQLDRYGEILPEPSLLPDGNLENPGEEEMDRFSEWMDRQAEQQLFDHETE